jgi:MinD-like ATPase involved in chromosome partitioning or flagellar assembly
VVAKIVAFHSPQGGAGSSNILANVAAQLARRGQRVGVVDVDLQTPGVHVPLGLGSIPDQTLHDFLLGNCAIEAVAHDVGARLELGDLAGGALYVVPAGIRSPEITRGIRGRYAITPLGEGLRTLAKKLRLDYVLTDSHSGFSEEGLLAMALCDCLVLVLSTDQQDLQGAVALLEMARQLEVADILLVANMVLTTYDCVDLRGQLERVYGCPVAAILPFCAGLMALGSSGLFTLYAPEDPFSLGVGEIVERITGE